MMKYWLLKENILSFRFPNIWATQDLGCLGFYANQELGYLDLCANQDLVFGYLYKL